jgi:RimJ/RimL family protein N-acetyltransferase
VQPGEEWSGEVPAEVLGPRVVLRPYNGADAAAVWAAIEESRAHLARWLLWVHDYHDVGDVRDYMLRARAVWEQRLDLPLGIFARQDGRFLGGAGLHRIKWEERHFEIGYWLRLSALHRGYARETAAALTRLAFLDLAASRVVIRVREENLASRRVPEALGFQQEGTAPLPEDEPAAGGPLLVYALDRQSFLARPWAGEGGGERRQQ